MQPSGLLQETRALYDCTVLYLQETFALYECTVLYDYTVQVITVLYCTVLYSVKIL